MLEETSENDGLLAPPTVNAADVPPLRLREVLCFGVGEVSTAIFNTLQGFYLNAFLLETVQLGPGAVGILVLVLRCWDAATDPLLGYLSDRTRSRWGRRKPWLAAAALPTGGLFLASWWAVDWDYSARLAWFFVVLLLASTATTLIAVPYTAMTPELHPADEQRARATQARMMFGVLALLVGALSLSFVLELYPREPTELAGAYRVGAGALAPLVALAPFGPVLGAPRPPPVTGRQLTSLRAYIRALPSLLRNRPYLALVLLSLCCWTATAVLQSNLLLASKYAFNVYAHFPYVLVEVLITTIALVALYAALIRKVSKKIVYGVGLIPSLGVFTAVMFIPAENLPAVYLRTPPLTGSWFFWRQRHGHHRAHALGDAHRCGRLGRAHLGPPPRGPDLFFLCLLPEDWFRCCHCPLQLAHWSGWLHRPNRDTALGSNPVGLEDCSQGPPFLNSRFSWALHPLGSFYSH